MKQSLRIPRTGLGGSALAEWLALRRVSWGTVAYAEHGHRWLHDGQPICAWLHHALNDLVISQRIALRLPDAWGMRHARLTAAGGARLTTLSGPPGITEDSTATPPPRRRPAREPDPDRAHVLGPVFRPTHTQPAINRVTGQDSRALGRLLNALPVPRPGHVRTPVDPPANASGDQTTGITVPPPVFGHPSIAAEHPQRQAPQRQAPPPLGSDS